MRKLRLEYKGVIVPYVRMTQRGKFVSRAGQKYLTAQRLVAMAFAQQAREAGWKIVSWGDGREPVEVVRLTMLFQLPDMRTRDLSNLVKAIEDSMNPHPHVVSWLRRSRLEGTVQDVMEGIVYEDDRLVWLYGPTALVHDAAPGCEVLVEAMTVEEYRREVRKIRESIKESKYG